MKSPRRPLSLLLLVLLGTVFAATPVLAQGKKKNKNNRKADNEAVIEPVEEFEEGGFRKVNLDINGDQKADVYNYYRTGEGDESRLLVRKEINLNFEGPVDVVQIWDNGEMLREEIDADFDGRIDWKDYYDGGERIRAEWDTNFDDLPDLIRHYEGGRLSRVEMDTTGDKQMDYWEYYQEGIMQRSGWDLNADGKIDKWGER